MRVFGADYEICLEYGQKKLAARLLVNRGTDIRGQTPVILIHKLMIIKIAIYQRLKH